MRSGKNLTKEKEPFRDFGKTAVYRSAEYSRAITLPPEIVSKLDLKTHVEVYLAMSGDVVIITKLKEIDTKEPIPMACKVLAGLVELVRRKEEIDRQFIKTGSLTEADRSRELGTLLSNIRRDLELLGGRFPKEVLPFVSLEGDNATLLELGEELFETAWKHLIKQMESGVRNLVQQKKSLRELGELVSSKPMRESEKTMLADSYAVRLKSLEEGLSTIQSVLASD